MQQKNFYTGRVLVFSDYPKGSKEFRITNAGLEWRTSNGTWMVELNIPPGSWQLLGIGSEITEEVWGGVVESDMYNDGPQEEHGLGMVRYYRDYPDDLSDSFLFTATESGHSLIKSLGYEPGEVIVLFESKTKQ